MRVLMVSALWPPNVIGGAETYAAALAERLEQDGHEVGVVSFAPGGAREVAQVPSWPYRLDDYSRSGPAAKAAFHARDQLDPATAAVLDRAIRRFRPDVVHSHAVVGMSAAALLAPRLRRTAHVHTLHDYWLLCQRSTLVTAEGRDCATRCRSCAVVSAARLGVLRHRPADVVLAVSEALAGVHRQAGVRNVRVVYNPQPEPHLDGRREPIPGAVVFGYLGQLVDVKGVGTLLAAMARRPAGSTLLVGGSGPLEDQVRSAPDVEHLGWLDDRGKAEFFQRIDCLVVPSEWRDPAPLVVGEAVARGVPVIGADIGGIPELVPTSCRPLLFPAGSAEGLLRSLERFSATPATFAVDEAESRGRRWRDHLDQVVGAYEDARAAKAAR